ncbi:TonB-dependent receptor [Pseudoalteromonas sp. MMG005]|nr:TonB-dependent receptor [Pseudoalteromonas sp. MMG005]
MVSHLNYTHDQQPNDLQYKSMEMTKSLAFNFIFSSVIVGIYSPESLGSDDRIETIEIYAQKRAQTIDEVSIAVSHVTGQEITIRGVKDATELGHFVANMKISQNAAEGTPPAVNIRGVGLIDYNTANTSPVAMYIDGASVGSANNQLVDLFDIEQIEVLKGPQGTLFGRNSTGGAILIRSARPDAGSYGYITGGVGTDDWQKLQGMYNHAVDEESAIRLAFSHTKYEYTSYNLFEPSPEAGLEQNNARLSYLGEWDSVSVYLKAHYSHWNGIVQPVGSIGIYSDPVNQVKCSASLASQGKCVDSFGFNDGSDDFWAVSVNNDSPHNSIGKGWTAEVDWQVTDTAQLVWVNAFSRLDREHAFNCDGSPAKLCEGNMGLKAELLNNELRYQVQLDEDYLTTGLFLLEERLYQDNNNDLGRDLRGTPFGANSAKFYYDNDIKSKVTALFAQYEWQWLPSTRVTAGLRYSDESVEYDSVSNINVVVDQTMTEGVLLPFYHVVGKNDDDGFSGKVAINYQLAANKMLYYSFANGNKSGGYNGGYLSSPEQAKEADYGPESLNAHELGAKVTLPDVNLKLNGAIFYYDYQDQQVFMNQPATAPGAPPIQLLENVAASTIYGAELDLEYDISNTMVIKVGVGYIPHAEFENYTDPLGVTLSDKRLPFTSEININAQLSYEYTIGHSVLTSSLGVDYQSEYYFDQNQSEYAMQSGYALWHFNTLYRYEDWQANLWAKNLFDQEYSHLKFDLSQFLGMLEDFKGEGRRIGVDFTYRF